MVERQGRAITELIARESVAEIKRHMERWISPEAELMTDGSHIYRMVSLMFASHQWVDHGADEYARTCEDGGPSAHNNTAESLNAIIERVKVGVFHMMSKTHLHRYLAEVTFRWNERWSYPQETPMGTRIVVEQTRFSDRMARIFSRVLGRELRRSSNGGLCMPLPRHDRLGSANQVTLSIV